jgi:UDP:flavonoid glycosyltransferase YjiC (YdhE family)
VKILFSSIGAYGHLYPMMPLALAARDAGHDVVIATADPFLGDRLPLPTVAAYVDLGVEAAVAETRRRHPDLTGADLSIAMFADATAEYITPTMVDHCERLQPDLVVYEAMNTGAGVAADLVGIPAAAFAIGLARFVYPILHEATIGYRRGDFEARGLEVPSGPLLASALIDPAPPALRPDDGYVTPTIPIRTVAYNEGTADVPNWLAGQASRPRVFLTLGTVAFGAVEVLSRAITEIAALDVDLLVAVGPEGDASLLGDLPANVHVERFVAQSKVLPLSDVFVHHGGTGSVLAALENGLPQLILPQGADQFLNADLITEVGAGRSLLNEDQTPGAIRTVVEAFLGDVGERATAGRIRDEIAAMPTPAQALDTVLRLVGHG